MLSPLQFMDHLALLVASGMLSIEDVVCAAVVLLDNSSGIPGWPSRMWDGLASNTCRQLLLCLPWIFTAVSYLCTPVIGISQPQEQLHMVLYASVHDRCTITVTAWQSVTQQIGAGWVHMHAACIVHICPLYL